MWKEVKSLHLRRAFLSLLKDKISFKIQVILQIQVIRCGDGNEIFFVMYAEVNPCFKSWENVVIEIFSCFTQFSWKTYIRLEETDTVKNMSKQTIIQYFRALSIINCLWNMYWKEQKFPLNEIEYWNIWNNILHL